MASDRPRSSAAFPREPTVAAIHAAATASARLHDYHVQTLRAHWAQIVEHENRLVALEADMQVQKAEALTSAKLTKTLGLFSALIVLGSWIANHIAW